MSEHPMYPEEYRRMAEVEDHMWWYRALHRNILWALGRYAPTSRPDVLDAGCGTGGLIRRLVERRSCGSVQGLEIWSPACVMARKRSGVNVIEGSVNDLPFPDATFDAIVSADVLEEKGVDIQRAVFEAWRCLRPGGVYVVNVPAYQWLTSYHDRRVGVQRRFVRREVISLLSAAGFELHFASYWNTLLLPLAVVRRKWMKPPQGESDVREYSAWAEQLFGAVMRCEHACMRVVRNLPFGLSILAVGKKNEI